MGTVFLVASASTKCHVLAMGFGQNAATTARGIVGGVVQVVIVTLCGMVSTSLNVNKDKPGYENDTAFSVMRKVVREKGPLGLYVGSGPMAV